ncbi:NADPH:quinone reductase [Streptomyces sp.]|uniref:NADPH:quinone reductase n=1 Tax=Streptomyces sp. TaxID=1931 RepID=UPI002F40EEF9
MYAAYIDELGPPENIRYGRIAHAAPGPTDVLVDVGAVSVNPVDTLVRAGVFRTPMTFPFVIGRDLVGTVVTAGPGAPGFRPGDLVWCNSLGHGGRQGAACERAVVPADRLYPLPPAVDPATAVATVHPAATAYLALFTHGHLRSGETVLVAGGAGNVGSALVLMAAHAGARVVATATPDDADHCRALGADQVLDYRDPQLPRLLRRACPDGVDLHADTSGANDLPAAVDLLAPGGRIVLLAGARSRSELPVGPLYMKNGHITGFVISHASVAELAQAAAMANRFLAGGHLKPRRIEEMPLGAAGEAHRRLEAGEFHGRRIVLRPPGH